jgi:FkbM family methyltransferase
VLYKRFQQSNRKKESEMNAIDEFSALLQECTPPARWIPAYPVLIYGAGFLGKFTADYLKARGVEVAGFLDAQAKPGQYLAEVPVMTLADWLFRHDPAHYEVFIAIMNPSFISQISEIHQRIIAYGFARCIYLPATLEYFVLQYDLPRQFENPRQYYEQFLPELARLDTLLADEKSRQCVRNLVRARCRDEPIWDYCASDQYRPSGLSCPQSLRFIDGGAFSGDTLTDFSQHGYRFEAVAAFEPDPENFRKLVSNTTVSCENLIRFPCALGKQTKTVYFHADGSENARIFARGGGASVQCVALDDVLPDFCPNLIKMDIEGAEPDALIGAENLIARNRPHLAICVYHCLDHLWRIPFMIHEWNLGYRFYMRQHSPIFNTVLYAIPENVN